MLIMLFYIFYLMAKCAACALFSLLVPKLVETNHKQEIAIYAYMQPLS